MNGEIHREGKWISVKGSIGVSDLHVLCAALYHAIDQRGYADVTLDFLITTQTKRNLSSRSGIGGVLSAT